MTTYTPDLQAIMKGLEGVETILAAGTIQVVNLTLSPAKRRLDNRQ